jgi:putative ABC transport system permease protein
MTPLPHFLRSLLLPWRRPASAVSIVGILAVGIGAAASVFSLVAAVLLEPAPFREPDRLVVLGEEMQAGMGDLLVSSHANFLDWEARSRSFEGMAESRIVSPVMRIGEEPLRVPGSEVSPGFFPLLGIKPQRGRLLVPADFQAGAAPVVVLSDRLWRQRFGSDARWLGRTILVDGQPTSIVGILPVGIALTRPVVLESSDVLRPLRLQPGTMGASRGARYLRVLARLRPGVPQDRAAAELRSIAAVLAREHPDTNKSSTVRLMPLRSVVAGETRLLLLLLSGAASLVLLAACTNVANFLLVQTSVRKRELAIRAALGASRNRILGQLFLESLGLLLPAALGGFLVAWWSWNLFVSLVPSAVVDLLGVALDARAPAATALVSFVALVLINGLPGLVMRESSLAEVLTESGAGAGGAQGNQRARGLIVAAETALAVVLLLGAGLLIRSFLHLSRVDLGFRPEHVLVLDLELPAKDDDPVRAQAVLDAIERRTESRPGVRSAALTANFAVTTGVGVQPGSLLDWQIDLRGTSPGYLATMGIPRLAGRDFSPQDGAAGSRVAVVNATAARKLWPGETAVGKKIFLDWSPPNPREVIGVAGDVRGESREAPRPAVYLPYQQLPFSAWRLLVRTGTHPKLTVADVRGQVRSVDGDIQILQTVAMRDLLAARIEKPKVYTQILTAFAAAAFVLAAVGVYGVTAFAVAARRREIGIRIALGAPRQEKAHLLAELARLRQAQAPPSDPAAVNAERQALEAQLEALRKASPGDPAEMMKRTQQDLERLQAESQPRPDQVWQAVRLARWALVFSVTAISLFLGLILKEVAARRTGQPH